MADQVESVHAVFLRDEGAKTAMMTMVLLIATLLVATMMAAAVFELNRDLADKSTSASDEAVKGIGAGLEGVQVVGVRADDGDIVRLNVTLRASYGATVHLEALVVRLTDGATIKTLFPMDGTDHVSLYVLRDQDGSTAPPLLRMEAGDLVTVTLDLEVVGLPMAAGDRLSVQVMPEEGRDTHLDLQAPEDATGSRLVYFE